VYQGDCSSLSCVASSKHGCGSMFGSSLSWDSAEGAIYHIQVTEYDFGDVGSFTLRVDGTDGNLTQTASESCLSAYIPCV
jgi:hypothetical protein